MEYVIGLLAVAIVPRYFYRKYITKIVGKQDKYLNFQ